MSIYLTTDRLSYSPTLSLLVSQPNTLNIPPTHIAKVSSSLPQPQQPSSNGGNMCSSRGDFSCRLLPIALGGAVLCSFPPALPQTPGKFLLNDDLTLRGTCSSLGNQVGGVLVAGAKVQLVSRRACWAHDAQVCFKSFIQGRKRFVPRRQVRDRRQPGNASTKIIIVVVLIN